MSSATNGQSTTDTSREEGGQEGSKGLCLQQSSGAPGGSTGGEEGRPLIIHIENAREAKVFVVHGIQTAEEVRAKIFARYPAMKNEKLLLLSLIHI